MRTRDLIGTKFLISQTKNQSFNIDTILLADFVTIPRKTKQVYDLGTGNGALMLYLATKTNAKVHGFEIQKERYLLASNNILLNELSDQLYCHHQNILAIDAKDIDVVITNPPFFKVDENSNLNKSDDETIARHEVLITLEQLISKASEILKYGGLFYMVHRPDRIAEIIDVLTKYNLIIKELRFVHPYINQAPNHVLIRAKKNGNLGLKVCAPLIIYQKKQVLTTEMTKIYQGRE